MIALVIWTQASISVRTQTRTQTLSICAPSAPFFVQSTANAMVWFDWPRVLIDEIMETGYILDMRVMQIYWHLLTIGKKSVSNKGHSVENSPNDFPIFDSFVSLTSLPSKCSTRLHEAIATAKNNISTFYQNDLCPHILVSTL